MTTRIDGQEDAPPARPAATVVVFRRDPEGGPAQILMVERSGAMAFAGGAAVFPGGKVDPGDHDVVQGDRSAAPHDPDDAAARVAAIRETIEETGLVIGVNGVVTARMAEDARRRLLAGEAFAGILRDHGWAIDFPSLVPFARWWPRHREIRVYDTRFYLADVGTGALDLVADATENRNLFWAAAAEVLAMADAGRIRIIFPTRRNLERLAQWDDFDAVRRHALDTPQRIVTPWTEMRNGVPWLVIPSDAGYPVDGEPLEQASRG